MTGPPVLDTHAWVWWVSRDMRLSSRVLAALDELPHAERAYLCDISLWEVSMLVERGRLSFEIPFDEWFEAAAHPRSVRLISITPEIAAEVAALPGTFHRDPADRIIVATCRTLDAPILSHDKRITQARLVTRWKP